METTGFKTEKVNYLGIIMTNMNYILFQHNYIKTWNKNKTDINTK